MPLCAAFPALPGACSGAKNMTDKWLEGCQWKGWSRILTTTEQSPSAQAPNDPAAVARAVEERLRQEPDSRDLRIAGVLAYAQLGIRSRALELLDHPSVEEAARATLDAQIPRVESRIPWSRMVDRFRGNLSVFHDRTGLGPALENVWRSAVRQLQLHRLANGAYQVLNRDPGGPVWLADAASSSPDDVAESLRARWRGHLIRPIVVNGLGLGNIPIGVIQASRGTFLNFSPRVYLLESWLPAWAVVLHLHDWREILCESRVFCLAGEDALAQFEAALRDSRHETAFQIAGGAWPSAITATAVQERIDLAAARRETERRERMERVRCAVQQNYHGKIERICSAVRGAVRLRILGMTSRFTTVLQHTMRDLLDAFETAGHETRIVMEADDNSSFSPIVLLDEIERFEPDLLITIDHLRAEYPHAIPAKLPMLAWIQDALPNLFCVQAGEKIDRDEFVFGMGFSPLTREFGYPESRFYPCMIPPRSAPAAAEVQNVEVCDVMYLSNVSESPQDAHARFRDHFDGPALDLADRLAVAAERVAAEGVVGGGFQCAELVDALSPLLSQRPENAPLRRALIDHARNLLDRHMRRRVVSDLADWADARGRRLHLYGRGWESIPRFAPYARGVVEPGAEMARVWKSATVCIHAGLNSALHQRVLDGVSAGAFFLIQESVWESRSDITTRMLRIAEAMRERLPLRLGIRDLDGIEAEEAQRFLKRVCLSPETGVVFTHELYDNLRMSIDERRPPLPALLWPDLPRIVFHGREQLWQRLDWALAHPQERRDIAGRMQQALAENISYAALVRDLLRFMANGLENRGNAAKT